MTSSFCNFLLLRSLLLTMQTPAPPTLSGKPFQAPPRLVLLWCDRPQSPTPRPPSGCSPSYPTGHHPPSSDQVPLAPRSLPNSANLFLPQRLEMLLPPPHHTLQASSLNCHEHYCLSQKPRPSSLSHAPGGRGTQRGPLACGFSSMVGTGATCLSSDSRKDRFPVALFWEHVPQNLANPGPICRRPNSTSHINKQGQLRLLAVHRS